MSNNYLQKVGLGTWAFGGSAYGPMEDQISIEVAKKAFELGVRFFDTASVYAAGKSEELLGSALESKSEAIICTKLGYDIRDGKAVKRFDLKFLDESLKSSLHRLRRNHLEFLLLHNPPTEILEKPEVYKWLRSKVADGAISKWGISVYDSVRDAELALEEGAQVIEARYSLIRRDVIDTLPSNKWKFDFIARSPLDGGILSGKYDGTDVFQKTDQRSAQNPEYIKTNYSFLEELQFLIDQGVADSFPEIAIRFAAFAPSVSRVIPGAKSALQLENNIASIKKGPLPQSSIEFINVLKDKYLPKLSM